MASPRAGDIVNDLRQDAFARDVLERVDTGPYVSFWHFLFYHSFQILSWHLRGPQVVRLSEELHPAKVFMTPLWGPQKPLPDRWVMTDVQEGSLALHVR